MICRKCKAEVPDAPFCCQCGCPQEAPERKRTRRGNGMGRVYKRGRFWYAQITRYCKEEVVDGKKIMKQPRLTKGGFATKKAALEYIEILKSAPAKQKAPRLIDLYDDWLAHDYPKLSESKQSAYRIARKSIEPIIGMRITDVTTADMQGVIDACGDVYYKARDIKSLFSHLYKKALPDQYVTQNLATYLALPDRNEKEPVPFTSAEVDKMWGAFADGNTFVGYMLLMIYSGMMPGELMDCRKDMIDLEKCEIYGCGKKTKTRKDTPIVFADCVRPVVEELMRWKDGDLLQPQGYTEWYHTFHKVLKEIGVRDLMPYSCRHTTGTEAAKNNISAPIIQKIMRHARITTSQRYIHLSSEDAHNAINSFEKSNPLANK